MPWPLLLACVNGALLRAALEVGPFLAAVVFDVFEIHARYEVRQPTVLEVVPVLLGVRVVDRCAGGPANRQCSS